MASLTLNLQEIKNSYYITYFFQTQAYYDYVVSLPGTDVRWVKPYANSGEPQTCVGHTIWTGESGKLTLNVECPRSNNLQHGFSGSMIVTPTGSKTLGYSYIADFDDSGGDYIDFNDLYVNVIGWKYYG